jgi:ribosomal protein L7Ae-like RNA K-turn-binding protein
LKSLKQNKQLAIGAKDVIKGLGSKCIVFIVNIAETAAITKHMISICRASSIPHVVLPKFQHEALCKLLGVKRLTCFSLMGERAEEKVKK